ncbi:Nitric oxide reductase activation protein [Blautia obeum]|uniref:Nitric oxide reductase activation protein n=1 Tax=Blautia obeum TaxID=40520 RepID=A0A174GWU5_9FIRM|nr:nitric oxide reductase activation protein [Blautia obeum]CUO65259.1 Nitric oxide reductase activation protein [Blautia obeum]
MEDVRWPAEQLEEHRLEVSNRIRNLFWTVSGDYDIEFEPDTEKYVYSKQTVLYEAVKQGAFARYFDQKKLGMYLMKKIYFSAGEDMLLPLTGLCMDAAVNRFIIRERLGTKEIREQAFRELEKAEEEQVSDKAGTDLIHRIRLLYIRHVLENTDDKGMEPQAVRRIREYVELNYGKSYLSESEQVRVNRKFCTGIHKNCILYLTDGILQSPVIKNNQYRFSQLQFEKNKAYYGNNHWIIKRNISVLAESLKRAFIIRKDDFVSRSDAGQLVPERLWKIGRTDDDKLFNRKKRSDDSEFVIDVLIDSSGSQADRQAQVAAQGYIISEALSQAGIPHRVTGYCAFWGYTVLQRFRDYEDPRETNERIFQFRAYANNRDGLALKTVSSSLMERPEKNKILIVLSDGKPCDMSIQRPGTRQPKIYDGEKAAKDTAYEVRRARNQGIFVIGIFVGNEEELSVEKRIYGKDFAYIRNISNFSRMVGTFLRRQIDME